MARAHDNNFAIGNTHVRHSLVRVLLDDLAANELHNANDDDEDQHSDVGNVQHVAVVAVTDSEVAQTARADDTRPVSYTHLDVYKRQLHYRTGRHQGSRNG